MASVCAVHYVSTPGDMAPYEPLVTLRVYRAQTTVPEPYGTDADWGQGTFRSNYDHERSPRPAHMLCSRSSTWPRRQLTVASQGACPRT